MRSLLDTNVLVYADSADERARQRRAIELIKQHRAAGTAVLATQVLWEFVNVALRRLGLPPPLIRERLDFYGRFDLVQMTPALIAAALDLTVLHGVSFYDALIVQAAAAAGCEQLLSEDMQPGRVICGVRIVNPFDDGT